MPQERSTTNDQRWRTNLRVVAKLRCVFVSLAVIGLPSIGCDQATKPKPEKSARPFARENAGADPVAKDKAVDAEGPGVGTIDANRERKPRSEHQRAEGETTPGEKEARRLLADLAATYQRAQSYSDSGEIDIELERDGQPQSYSAIPFSTTFVRPNRVRLHAFSGAEVCDGRELRAVVNELPNQVLVTPSPLKMEYSDAFLDPVLAASLRGAMSIELWPLALLTDSSFLSRAVDEATQIELLDNGAIDKIECRRVRLHLPAGQATFWIDAETPILHRVEYPTDAIRRQEGVDAPSRLTVMATFVGARVNPNLPPEAFSLELPHDARLVKRFLPPPPELPPAILGQRPSGYEFDDLIGGKVTAPSLAGKTTVISFWAAWSQASIDSLIRLQPTFARLRDDKRVTFLAVNVDADDVDDDQAAATLREAKVTIPLARDRSRHHQTSFQVEGLPTIYLIGPDGAIQDVEIGDDAVKTELVVERLDSLLDGEDLVAAAVRRYEQSARAYEEENVDAIIGATTSIALPKAEILPYREPQTIALKRLWTVQDVRLPGNLLVVDATDGPRIVVIEASRGVAEIDTRGQVVARRKFDLSDGEAVSRLRTATDADGGRLFAAFAVTQRQAHLFDQDWNAVLHHPEADARHPGIADVQLGDFDADGRADLAIGYLGPVGIHAVSSRGERLWRERSTTNILGLALACQANKENGGAASVSPAVCGLWCANGGNTIARLNAQGELEQSIPVGGESLFWVHETPDGAGGIVALSQSATLDFKLLGVNQRNGESWSYALPRGLFDEPVEPCIVCSDWWSAGESMIVAPAADGTIHMIDGAGRLVDTFATGATIAGVVCARIDDQPVLIVSGRDAIIAWQVRLPDSTLHDDSAANVPAP